MDQATYAKVQVMCGVEYQLSVIHLAVPIQLPVTMMPAQQLMMEVVITLTVLVHVLVM